tara:strand:+ start:6632 stop:7477 length:846 start_codon:yes stop_codon:yes gene_type:complete
MPISGGSIGGGDGAGGFIRDYTFQSFSGSSGTNYVGGFYDLQAADENLTQAALTGTYGTANISYAAHAILVAGGVGSVAGGTTGTGLITVSGTSITDAGVRTTSDTEVIISDVTSSGLMAANTYHETVKKWIGTVTYTLSQDGDRTTYNANFNVGLAKYDDIYNRDFNITGFEVVGLGGATDTSFNVALETHSPNNWTYHATAFSFPTGNDIVNMNTDHVTETDLANGVGFSYRRIGLSTIILGSAAAPTTSSPNGFLIRVTTGANASVQDMSCHVIGDYI